MQKLLFLLFFAVGSVAAQDFAPIGARWYYNSMGQGTAPSQAEYTRLEVVKDTSINGIPCRKIEVTHFQYRTGDSIQRQPYYVRESGDTAYYWHNHLQRFSPLCMFNALPGDTLTFDVPPHGYAANQPTQFQVVVDSVTLFTQGSDTLKAFYTSAVWQGININTFSFHGPYFEKVGPTFLFMHQSTSILIASDGPLRCYSDDVLFINLMGIPCDYRLVASVTSLNSLSRIRYYPNPFTESITLDLPGATPVLYAVYDLQGRQLQAGNCTTAGENRIDMQSMNAGVYFLRLQSGQHTAYHKIVRE